MISGADSRNSECAYNCALGSADNVYSRTLNFLVKEGHRLFNVP